MAPPLYGAALDNLLLGALVSGTAPSTSYTLDTLLTPDPAARVRFGTGSVSIDFTLDATKQGAVLVLPVTSADPDTDTITLSNGAGLSVDVPIPVRTRSGIPRTVVLDFSAQPNRTSDTWTIDFDCADDLTLGGAIGIFPYQAFRGLRFDFTYTKTRAAIDEMNEYRHRRRLSFRTFDRAVDCVLWVPDTQLATVEDWFDASDLDAAALLYPQLTGLDAYVGTLPPTFVATRVGDTTYFEIAFTFAELSKGKPVF